MIAKGNQLVEHLTVKGIQDQFRELRHFNLVKGIEYIRLKAGEKRGELVGKRIRCEVPEQLGLCDFEDEGVGLDPN